MSARGPDGACAKCNSTNTRQAEECSDHPGVIRCLDCGEVMYGGGIDRDARLGALEPPGSYGLCWRDLPGGGKCERERHEGPCAPFALLAVEPSGRRETAAFVDYADGSGSLEQLSLAVYPPSPNGERLREVRTGVCREELGAFLLSVDPAAGTVSVGSTPTWVKLGEPIDVEVEGRRYVVTEAMLREAAEAFEGEAPVDDGADLGPWGRSPARCLGWIGRAEMWGSELWGLVRWVEGAKPAPLSYVLEVAPAPRLRGAYLRRYTFRVGDLVSWGAVAMTIAGFEGEQIGRRVARCTWDEDPARTEAWVSEAALVRRKDPRFLGLGEAARLAGVGTVEFSGLETGRYTLADGEWERLFALVDVARRAKPAEGPRGPSAEGRGER